MWCWTLRVFGRFHGGDCRRHHGVHQFSRIAPFESHTLREDEDGNLYVCGNGDDVGKSLSVA